MSDEDSPNVVQLAKFLGEKKGTREPVPRKRRAARGECRHVHSELDIKLRQVLCAKCGQRLDPLSVLLAIVDSWDRLEIARDGCKRETKWLRDEIEKLKRQRRNLKAQIRRAEARAVG